MGDVQAQEATRQNDEAKIDQYLTFTLADEQYAVSVLYVWKVLEYTQITRVPKTPDFMRGVINLHGSVVPVMDLRLKFNMSKTEQNIDTSIIAMEIDMDGEKVPVGVLADSVEEVIELSENNIEPAPKIGTRVDNEFIQGMGKKDEDFIILLNIEKIFSIEEIQSAGSWSQSTREEKSVQKSTEKGNNPDKGANSGKAE